MTVRVRGRSHRGVVRSVGIVFEPVVTSADEARWRALRTLHRHLASEVHAAGGALVVRFASPEWIDVERAGGAPLVVSHGVACTAELTAREASALRERGVEACRLVGGFAAPIDVSSATAVRTAQWIDERAFVLEADVVPLGSPPPPPVEALPAVTPDVRQALGVPAAEEGAHALASALARRSTAADAASVTLGRALGALSAIAAAASLWAGRWIVPLVLSLRRARPSSGPSAPGRSSTPVRQRPAGPSWWTRLTNALASAVMRSRLAEIVGREQARYLERMLQMFDENDLDAALRHAIPLGGEATGERATALVPRPRDRLDIALGSRGGAASIHGSGDVYELLRRRYRAAFEALVRRGEIEKAAFVLAELLRADEEAVSFLERHGRRRLAAELAEARGLAPGLQIRQWFLARDVPRALAIAQRTGAFSDAVLRLSRDHPDAAEALRIAWAERLASTGAYGAAVDVLWPLEKARGLASAWVERAIGLGGPTGARMLAFKASLDPSTSESVYAALVGQLARSPELQVPVLAAFAAHLAGGGDGSPQARLARAVWRRAAHAGEGLPAELVAVHRNAMARLLATSRDAVLSADAAALEGPTAGPSVSLADREPALRLDVGASDRGGHPVRDVMVLPDGRMLVALGEAGLLLLSAQGTTQRRIAQPAWEIIASDHGDRAIVRAPRGEVSRLARIDLSTGRADTWCDVRLTAWASTFDGERWFVGVDDEMFAIDATRDDWAHHFHVQNHGVRLSAIVRDEGRVRSLWGEPFAQEVWTHALPSMSLSARTALSDGVCAGIAPSATLYYVISDERLILAVDPDGPSVSLPNEPVCGVGPGWAVTDRSDDERHTLAFRDLRTLTPRIELVLGGGSMVRVRVGPSERALVFDDWGRILWISLRTGALLASHRVTG